MSDTTTFGPGARTKRGPAIYVMAPALVRAIRRAPQTISEIGYPFGFVHSNLCGYLAGKRFGPQVRERIVRIGAALGVPEARCTRTAR